MKVLVCGGRDYSDRQAFLAVMKPIWEKSRRIVDPPKGSRVDLEIISGMASGADTLAVEFAKAFNLKLHPYPAKWTDLSHPDAVIRTRRDGTKYDAKAGHRRNQQMLDEGKPDLVVAFPTPGARNSGTKDMMARADAAGVEVIEATPS